MPGFGHKGLSSIPNPPEVRQGPAGGMSRAPDGTEQLAVVCPEHPKGKTAIFG